MAELYSLDLRMSYEHAFVYIRQLAIHLRNAMTLKKKDAYVHVYNMQFLSCLRGMIFFIALCALYRTFVGSVGACADVVSQKGRRGPRKGAFSIMFHDIFSTEFTLGRLASVGVPAGADRPGCHSTDPDRQVRMFDWLQVF